LNTILNIFKKAYNTVKNDFILILGNYGLRIASFLFTLVVAKKISPANYGVFGLATLIVNYLTYFNFGSQYSINKELSIDIKNRIVNAYAIINTFVYSIILLIFYFFAKYFNLFPSLNDYLYYLFFYPLFFNILEISNGILRAHNQSNKLGLIKLAGTIFVVFVTIYYFFIGVSDNPSPLFSRFLFFSIIQVIVSMYYLKNYFIISVDDFVNSINYKNIKYLIWQGLILSIYITIDGFTKSIDRLFVASFYSKEDLGFYSFGFSLQGPFLLALSSIMYMDFSRILKNLKGSSIYDFRNNINKLYKKLFLIWSFTLIIAIIGCFFFLKFYLPNYYNSFPVVIIYIINYFVTILLFPFTSYFIANNLISRLIKIIIIPNIINIILSYIVVLLNLPFYYIMVVSIPSNLFYFILLRRNFFRQKL